ncbi:E3 ORFA [bat adenovirus 3]|uniref:E3 ORFA n=1 Tax=bat adenovirus 3 TaxID=2758098 RepID=D3X7C9_9ADEN|nr:E3 ORFA [bat adenovirus 3]ADD17118.1 E3 ORFA [bat adenovirus 3]
MALLLFAAVLFLPACLSYAPEHVVSCCAGSPCSLDLSVSPQASVNWSNPETGGPPECLARELCNITRDGLHFSANFSEDGPYAATVQESAYFTTEHFYLLYLHEVCRGLPIVPDDSYEAPVARPLEDMPLERVARTASLFQPLLLELPPEHTQQVRNVRWYKVTGEYAAQKVSRVRSQGRVENIQPNLAVALLSGDLWVLHVSPDSLGLWLAIVQHPGGRCHFVTYNLTVPGWQENLVHAFRQGMEATTATFDPLHFTRKMKWSLYRRQPKGAFRVECNTTSRFPDCFESITPDGVFLLVGERKDSLYVSMLPFFPSEGTLSRSQDLPEPAHSTFQEPAMPSYVPLTFLIIGMLSTLVLLLGLCCCLSNKIRPIYFPPTTAL